MTHQEIYPDLETAILWAIALFSEAIREVDFNVITDPAEREGIAINTQPGYEFCEPGSTGVLWSNGVLREGAIEHLRVSTGGKWMVPHIRTAATLGHIHVVCPFCDARADVSIKKALVTGGHHCDCGATHLIYTSVSVKKAEVKSSTCNH